ncbi:hypothetical protein [Streptomyces sp. NPDC057494]|uniref:hypothetical protein n=1 Tax=Streptomyces sp. NPDC057494 TaxID=3346148 RepID=UPI0036BD64EA
MANTRMLTASGKALSLLLLVPQSTGPATAVTLVFVMALAGFTVNPVVTSFAVRGEVDDRPQTETGQRLNRPGTAEQIAQAVPHHLENSHGAHHPDHHSARASPDARTNVSAPARPSHEFPSPGAASLGAAAEAGRA